MNKLQLSGMLDNKAINVGETWSSPDRADQGLVIGFKTNGDAVIEMTKCTKYYYMGQVLSLENSNWIKVVPKRKVHVYYNPHSKQFYCTESEEKPNSDVHLMETREYEIKE